MFHFQNRAYLTLLFCLVCSIVLHSCAKNLEVSQSFDSTDSSIQKVINLNTNIQSVSSGGLWTHGEQSGWLRFVVTGGGVEHYRTYLYIQWFSQADDNSNIEHLKTVSVTELSEENTKPATIARYTFNAPECKEKTTCTKAIFEAYDILEGTDKQFTLFLENGPGKYRLKTN